MDPTSHERNEDQSTPRGHSVVVQASDLKQHDHKLEKANTQGQIQSKLSHDFNNIQTRNVVISHLKNIVCLKVLEISTVTTTRTQTSVCINPCRPKYPLQFIANLELIKGKN